MNEKILQICFDLHSIVSQLITSFMLMPLMNTMQYVPVCRFCIFLSVGGPAWLFL